MANHSDYNDQIKSYSTWMAGTAAAIMTPVLAKFMQISPPQHQVPEHLDVFAGLASIPIIVMSVTAFKHMRPRAIKVTRVILGTLTIILLVLYLHLFQDVTIKIETALPGETSIKQELRKTTFERIVIGSACGNDALLLYPNECKSPVLLKDSIILDEFASAGKGLPGSLWAQESIQKNATKLSVVWISMYCSLVALVISAAVVT